MEQVGFSYAMKIEFSSPVVRHCFSLRCLPFDNEYQTIRELFIEVSPHNVLTETADRRRTRSTPCCPLPTAC